MMEDMKPDQAAVEIAMFHRVTRERIVREGGRY